MSKPPPSGPHSDIHGANPNAPTETRGRDASKGSAQQKHEAEVHSKGRPADSGPNAKPD